MREIVTLQFGQRSNYLGTHFWNTQESYFTYSGQEESLVDHDIHFRPGIGADGTETFTPRALIYDLRGGFGSLRKINALYDATDESSTVQGLWDGTTSRIQNDPIQPSEFQTLLDQGYATHQIQDKDVRYWSDFNRIFYHPRSLVQLNEYELHSQVMPFENWSAGEELFNNLDKEFELLDRDVRLLAEECDNMQGFQMLTGTDDAWGGFAAKYSENLRDEYGKSSIWVWGLEDGSRMSRTKQLARAANAARSLQVLGQQASTYTRVAVPAVHVPEYVNMYSLSEWVATGLLCVAFETATLPTRLKCSDAAASLESFESLLNTNGNQKLLDLRMTIGDSAGATISNDVTNGTSTSSFHDERTQNLEVTPSEPLAYDISFDPRSGGSQAQSEHFFAQVESYRHGGQTNTHPMVTSLDERLRRRLNEETVVERFDTRLPFPLLDTFPSVLFDKFSHNGGLEVSAALTSSSRMKNLVMNLRNDTTKLVEVDERENLYNDLTDMANGYGFGWDSGSDSGEDS